MVRSEEVKAGGISCTPVMVKFKPAPSPLSPDDTPAQAKLGALPERGSCGAAEGADVEGQTPGRWTGMSKCPARNMEARKGLSPGLHGRRGSLGTWPDTVSANLSLQAWPECGVPWAPCPDSRTQNTGEPQDSERTAAGRPGCPEYTGWSLCPPPLLLQWDTEAWKPGLDGNSTQQPPGHQPHLTAHLSPALGEKKREESSRLGGCTFKENVARKGKEPPGSGRGVGGTWDLLFNLNPFGSFEFLRTMYYSCNNNF